MHGLIEHIALSEDKKQLLREEVGVLKVKIIGMTDKVPQHLSHTKAETKEAALRNVVFKITRYVQDPTSPPNKDWHYQDGKFKARMDRSRAPLILNYLKDNPRLWTVEPVTAGGNNA